MNLTEHLPAILLAVPLLGAFASPIVGKGGKNVRWAWMVGISSLIFVICLAIMRYVVTVGPLVYVMGGEGAAFTLPSGMRLPIRIIMEIDALSAFCALMGSVAALAAAVFSLDFMEKFSGLDKYCGLFFMLELGMLGMMVTGDAFNFFVFLEIASVASFGLVAFWRDRPEAIEAGIKYMLVSTIGALLVLVAIGFLYARYNALNIAALGSVMEFGTPEKIALALLITSLAMKCGAFPMHMWTPDTYAEAPASVTCLLVAVSQASLYGLFRVCFSLYGLTMNSPAVGWIIIVLGLLSMFIGVTMAVIQKDIARLMAYHSVSQVGYLLLGLGVGLVVLSDPQAEAAFGFTAIKGSLYHLVNYTMYKGLLFLTAGAIYFKVGSRNLNDMGGLAHNMKWTTVFYMIGAAAIAGLPPFNGFVSKLLLYESSFALHPLLAVVAMVVSVLTLASFVKVFQTAFLGPKLSKNDNITDVPKSMLYGMGILVTAIMILTVFPQWTMESLIEPAARAVLDQAGYIGLIMGGGM